jgi:hypothetical protein
MFATQMFGTPTAAVLFDNGQSAAPAHLRLANETGTGDVRLSGTPTGLTASSGYRWQPTHGLVQQIDVNAGGVLAVCANATQVISLLGGHGT